MAIFINLLIINKYILDLYYKINLKFFNHYINILKYFILLILICECEIFIIIIINIIIFV
jgi:hypothetical protein